jgi:hypothetical protein
VALWTYAFQTNRDLDPRYAAAADFCRNWLENQFLAKWYQRAGGDPLVAWNTPYAAFYKPDTEPRSANFRLAYYLWKVTGNSFYLDRANEILNQLVAAQVINPAHPTAYRWAKELDPTTLDWQLTNYANYYMRVIIEMNLEGLPVFSDPVQMKRFAATFRDVVYAPSGAGSLAMTNDVNGTGTASYTLYAYNGFAPWDSTGFLMDLANRSITGVGHYSSGGVSKAARNDVFISAYALMSLRLMETTATLITSFDAIPQSDGTVRIEWELSPDAADLATNLYRVSPNGVEMKLVTPSPITGPGPHVVIDTPPSGSSTLTYELTGISGGTEQNLGQIQIDRGPSGQVGFTLDQNQPNPFATSTLIQFEVPESMHVTLGIFDPNGRRVRALGDETLAPGRYVRQWDGRDDQGATVPNGIYFYVAEAGGHRLVRRAIRMQ